MSFTKQFMVQDEVVLGHTSEGIPDPTPHDYQATFAAALGINTSGMVEVVISDLGNMITKNQRNSLEGYIQCLYRIMSHKVAWECIVRAYTSKNEIVPAKVKKLFGRDEYEVKERPKMIAE